MSRIITRENLHAWLVALLKDHSLVAPTAAGGMVLFRPIRAPSEIVYAPGNATLGPKECLFPLSHTVFTVEQKDGKVEAVPSVLDQDMVIFGLRPCDAQGFAVFDLPMLQEPADEYYKNRRQRTTLVGIACRTAEPDCFCTSTGGGPNDSQNLDVMLTEVPEGFVVQAITEKGEKVLENAKMAESAVEPPKAPDMPQVPTKDIAKTMRQVFQDQYWSRLADRCTHCNICSYVCPTCYCFDMRDYHEGGQNHRVRSWESCQAPGFTKIAGGHDPRADKGAKLRQRFAHKLLYFPEEFQGVLCCTGCGRCIRHCPVNIDIRELAADVHKIGGG